MFGVIALVIIIVLILKFAPWLIYGIGKVIAMPFKGLAAFYKCISRRRRDRQEKKVKRKKKSKQPKPPDLSGNVKPEEVDKYLDSIDWDSVDWKKLDGRNG